MIAHHPSDAFLLDYASGAAAEPGSVLIATHLALCPLCRDKVKAYEHIGGALIETSDTEAVSDSLKNSVLAALDSDETVAVTPSAQVSKEEIQPDTPTSFIPQPLRGYCDDLIEKEAWQWSGIGIKKIPLIDTENHFDCYLLAIREGKKVPLHDHRGGELTLVLEGGFTDDTGHFIRGDIAERQQGEVHQPVADPGTDCICLVVADAPVILKGTVGRFLNKFLGD